MPSKVFVVVLLVVVTGAAYLMVHGGSGTNDEDPMTAWSNASVEPLEIVEPDISVTLLENSYDSADLWPADDVPSTSVPEEDQDSFPSEPAYGMAGDPSEQQTQPIVQGWPNPGNSVPNEASASFDSPAPGESSSAALIPTESTTPVKPQPNIGPIFTWRNESAEQDRQPSTTERVEGWPTLPEGSNNMVGPSEYAPQEGGTQPSAYPQTNSWKTSDHYSPATPIRTGMRDQGKTPRRPSSISSGAARLDGTVETLQPRANYERTRPSLY